MIVEAQLYSTPRWQFAFFVWHTNTVLLAVPLVSRHEEFTKSAHNHTHSGSCGAPMKARQMMDANFLVAASSTRQSVQQFRINHRPTRLQWMLMQEISTQQFESTIHIPYMNI